MRLIEADELFKDFEKSAWFNNADRDDVAEELLLNAPTIDAEPVRHGHWVICSDGYYPYCSKCKQEPDGKNMTNYCSNCGAKMMDEVNE